MTNTTKLLVGVGLGVGSAILTNGLIRGMAETQDSADASKPNMWFRYSPFISAAAPVATGLLLWKLAGWGSDVALVAGMAGVGASLAVPANDYVLTNLREVPVTTIPMDVGRLRGVGKLRQFAGKAAA